MTPDATEAIRQINEIADGTTDGAVRALSTRAVHDITEADSWDTDIACRRADEWWSGVWRSPSEEEIDIRVLAAEALWRDE
jgi:hypothetical protein